MRLNIYEVRRARKLRWMDVNVKNRKGVLMCPSGSTFTVLTVPYVPKTEPLRICRTNLRAEGLGEHRRWDGDPPLTPR